MVITKDGSRIYALSESGFVVLPLSTMNQIPIAMPDQNVVLLANDQCGVTARSRRPAVTVKNMGGGNRMTVTAQLQPTTAGNAGLGGVGGPGGGGPAGGVVIILPGIVIGGGAGRRGRIRAPAAANGTPAATTQTAPLIRTTRNPRRQHFHRLSVQLAGRAFARNGGPARVPDPVPGGHQHSAARARLPEQPQRRGPRQGDSGAGGDLATAKA